MGYESNPERYEQVTAHMASGGDPISVDNPFPTFLRPSPSGYNFELAIIEASSTELHADYPCKFILIQNPLDDGIRILLGFAGSPAIFEVEPGRTAVFQLENLNQVHAKSTNGNHTINVGALD